MGSIIKELAKELRESLPFGIVNSNPKNSLAKKISYNNIEEAKSFGYDNIIGDTSMSSLDLSGINIPTTISTAINAHQIFIYDLDNPNHVWDWNEARKIIKNTSWYQELGEPPIHGFFILSADRTKIHWVNRESKTLDIYMTFDASASNSMIDGSVSGPDVVTIYILDFILYTCYNGGFPVIDLLSDRAHSRNASGEFLYKGNISQRNTGGGYALFADQPVPAVANGGSIIAWRDYDKSDNFGRPLHYWAINTAVSGAVPGPVWLYVPSNDTSETAGVTPNKSYEGGRIGSTTISDSTLKLAVSKDGIYFNSVNIGGLYSLTGGHIKSRNQNDWTNDIGYLSTTNGIEWWQRPITLTSCNDLASYSNHKYVYQLSGWNEGLLLFSCKTNVPGSGSVVQSEYAQLYRIITNSTYASPLMVGKRYAAYPLHSDVDVAGGGRNLSTVFFGSGPTFSSVGGPLGPKAYFDGTTAIGMSSAIAHTSSSLSVSYYIKLASNCASAATVSEWGDGASDRSWKASAGVSGGFMYVDFNIWTGSNQIIGTPGFTIPYVADKWYHIVATWKAGSFYRFYVDGVLIEDAGTVPGALQNSGIQPLRVGAKLNADQVTYGQFLIGDIANVMVSETPMSEKQIQIEYMRMKMGLAGYSFTLSADDIDSINIDHESGLAVVCAGDVAHIMDIETGAILETKAISQGTLNNADITTVNGSDKYQYILAGSNTIEQFGSEVKL